MGRLITYDDDATPQIFMIFLHRYNQITTCLAADLTLFNSVTLRSAFLDNIGKHLKLQPDQRPDVLQIREEVEKKSRVCYFPLSLPKHILDDQR